jgi:hypothetical protein
VHQNKRDKLDHTSIKTIFLGSSQKKRYKCYNPINKKLHISRVVIFFEDGPFYSKNNEILDDIITIDDFKFPTINHFEEQVVLENDEVEESEGNNLESDEDEVQEGIEQEQEEIELRRSS